jgi:beta-lactamase superfamily II metal-dependent hydrolase
MHHRPKLPFDNYRFLRCPVPKTSWKKLLKRERSSGREKPSKWKHSLRWGKFAAITSILLLGLGTPPAAPDSLLLKLGGDNDAASLPAASLFLRSAWAETTANQPLRIYHLDIGQGDATIIVGPGALGERKVMVVDAGNIPGLGSRIDGGLRVIQALQRLGIQKVDYTVLTHFDSDHVGGFATGAGTGHSFLMGADNAPGVAGLDDDGDGKGDWLDPEKTQPDREEMGLGDDFYQSSTLFIDRGSANVKPTRANIRYLRYANPARRHRVTGPSKLGKVLDLGGGASATVVCGNGWVWGRSGRVANVDTENEKSVGMLVTYHGFDYLVAGDLIGQKYAAEDANVEEPLADALAAKSVLVEVLHVNHHGASNASCPQFIEKLAPLVGVISLGDGNEYHHPTAQTLTTLFTYGVKVYQTEAGERSSVAGQGSSTVLHGHILVEAEDQDQEDNQGFVVKDWGTLGEVRVSDDYAVRHP